MHAEISLVLPTYNGSRFIRATLESALAQELLPHEIIVVDDASTDETVELVEAATKRAAVPIRLIRLERNSGGPAQPLNVGIEAAAGEFIVTLDQDDLMPPQRIAWQVGLLRSHRDCPLVFGLFQLIDEHGMRHLCPRIPAQEILAIRHRSAGASMYLLDAKHCYCQLIKKSNFVHGASNIAFRKEVWRRLGGMREHYRVVWDCDFACRACTLGDIGFIPRVVQYHRVHQRNLSGRGLLSQTERAELQLAHLRRPLMNVDLSDCHEELRELFFGIGYFNALQGNLVSSLRAYLRAVRLGVPKSRGLYGMLTALPHALAHKRRSVIAANQG